MRSKLRGWKAENLSLAGRITLIGYVAMTMPLYVMQSAKLHAITCEAVERDCRNFVWDDAHDKKKIHLLGWEKLCKAKDYGGLGLRSLRRSNKAFLMKLVWSLVSKPKVLWVTFIRDKYHYFAILLDYISTCPTHSLF